jgi:hypothetical protein
MAEIETEVGDLNPEQLGEESDENSETENSQNPSEGEPEVNQAPIGEQETPLKPEKTSLEIEEANKKLYARMKKAEDEAKELKAKLGKQETPFDSLSLAKTVSALKEFSATELDDIALISKAKGLPLEEAARTEEAKILVAARREKVAREQKAPLPSSSLPGGKSLKDIRTMSAEEHKALEESYRKSTRRQME